MQELRIDFEDAPAQTRTPDSILTSWTSVYPLSSGPAERIQRDAGTALPALRLRLVVAEFVDMVNSQLRPGLAMDADGNLHGPSKLITDPALELLTAVLRTDVHAILSRQPQSSPGSGTDQVYTAGPG